MGNFPSDGIKSGQKITRTCINIECQAEYEGWSDDTLTIKGLMHPCKYCEKCNQYNISKIDINFDELVKNMQRNGSSDM